MNDNLIVSVSPHYHKQGATTQRVMLDVLIAHQGLYHFLLQGGSLVVSRSDGIDSYRHNDVVTGIHPFRNASCNLVDLMRARRFGDTHVQGTDGKVGPISVQDDVKNAEHSFRLHHLRFDLTNKVGRGLGTQQLVDG